MEENVIANQKKGLGIAAVVLGVLSLLCCFCMGFGIVFAIVGVIFSIICIVKGTGSGRTLGIVGIILNGIGLLMGAYFLISCLMMIDWNNAMDPQIWNQLENIDPNNEAQMREWLQQLFRVDLTTAM